MTTGTISPRARILIAAALLVASILFWDSIVLAPVKLFVVLMHELSHGLAAVLTGGSIVRIDIDPRIGGTCLTRGGWSFVVVSSGYIGSLLLGGAILLAAQRARSAALLAGAIGVAVLLVTLLFVRNGFGLAFGVAFGTAMIAMARFLPPALVESALLYLGGMSALYAVVDVKEDLLTLQPRLTDAAIMASMTGIPAIVWGLLWSALSLVFFVVIMRLVWRRMQAADGGRSTSPYRQSP
jgi:hypothetical protein